MLKGLRALLKASTQQEQTNNWEDSFIGIQRWKRDTAKNATCTSKKAEPPVITVDANRGRKEVENPKRY
jgi:hypothetical protein